MSLCVYVSECVCACLCTGKKDSVFLRKCYFFMCVCVCVCVIPFKTVLFFSCAYALADPGVGGGELTSVSANVG